MTRAAHGALAFDSPDSSEGPGRGCVVSLARSLSSNKQKAYACAHMHTRTRARTRAYASLYNRRTLPNRLGTSRSLDLSFSASRARYGGMDDSKLGDSADDSNFDDSDPGGYGRRSGEGKGGEEKGGW